MIQLPKKLITFLCFVTMIKKIMCLKIDILSYLIFKNLLFNHKNYFTEDRQNIKSRLLSRLSRSRYKNLLLLFNNIKLKIIPPRKKLLPRQQRQTNTKDHEGIKETFQKKKKIYIIKKLKRIYETPLEIKEVMRIF